MTGTLSHPPFPCAEAPADLPEWQEARALRAAYWNKKVFLRGIIEISNYCRQNCLYCGLRRDNTTLSRYRMYPDDVFAAAERIKALGFGTVVLQSGEDPGLPPREVASLVMRIKRELGLAVTLSLGEWDKATYALWRRSGADRYLLKLETPDESRYAQLRPGKKLAERLESLALLAELGYETGSGFITGLPGETKTTLRQGLALLAPLKPDMLSLSPFTPHPDTPLKNDSPGSVRDNLYGMALARIAVPTAHIPVTSALGLHGDAVRLAALEVGDVLMPSLTPVDVRAAYAIYPGKNADERDPEERAAALKTMIEAAGFVAPFAPGGAWRLEKG